MFTGELGVQASLDRAFNQEGVRDGTLNFRAVSPGETAPRV
jgi:hypothetical protein